MMPSAPIVTALRWPVKRSAIQPHGSDSRYTDDRYSAITVPAAPSDMPRPPSPGGLVM
jgi:hypothetical protein